MLWQLVTVSFIDPYVDYMFTILLDMRVLLLCFLFDLVVNMLTLFVTPYFLNDKNVGQLL